MIEKNSYSMLKTMISNSSLLCSIAFIVSLINDATWQDFLNGLYLPFPEVLWIVPLVFAVEAIPSFFIDKYCKVMDAVNSGFNEHLFSTSCIQLAISYIFSTASEEILFRFAIQGLLVQFFGLPLGIIITSLLWFLSHGRYIRYWQMLVATMITGITFGVVYALTGSWLLVSICHFLHNFILTTIKKYQLSK